MAQVINTNLSSINTQRHLYNSQNSLNTALERLSSGQRINSAKDDAAGMAVASRMDSLVRGMAVAQRNASDGISMYQTAEASVGKIGDALSRMRELAVQAANGTLGSNDRDKMAVEFVNLQQEITRIISGTSFNGRILLDEDKDKFVSNVSFQVGAEASGANVIEVTASIDTNWNAITSALIDTASYAITNASGAASTLKEIDSGLQVVNSVRARYGAFQNRFESVISQLQVASENQSAARSRIMDTDFAVETANLTRAQILQQAGTAMLSQANSAPNNVLSLLR